jgi:RHS repeat-associated protein
VAKERGESQWNLAHDQLGTPTEMYDEQGELVWQMEHDSFGKPTYGNGPATESPWRWPGQYEDRETGLFYNRYRYYSPDEGRYISKDPLALWGSLDAFGYPTDPWTSIDPHGLTANHHTIPSQLVREMRNSGMLPGMTASDFDSYASTSRAGLAPLSDSAGSHAHSQAHSALSDYLNQRHGLSLRQGTQHGSDWQLYLNAVGHDSDQVFRDMDNFYRRWLPRRVDAGDYPHLSSEMGNLRSAYTHDRATVRACT